MAETAIDQSVGLFKESSLLKSSVPTACLLVHKREARERSERNPKRLAGSWLAALAKVLLSRKLKFLMKRKLPFRQKLTGLSYVFLELITSVESMLPKAAVLLRKPYFRPLRRPGTIFTPG